MKPRKLKPAGVTLPRKLVNGKKLTEHPVLTARRYVSRAGLAALLGITPQGVLHIERHAKDNRDFLLPAEQVAVFALAADLPPYVFRPDLFMPAWIYTASKMFPRLEAPSKGGLCSGPAYRRLQEGA